MEQSRGRAAASLLQLTSACGGASASAVLLLERSSLYICICGRKVLAQNTGLLLAALHFLCCEKRSHQTRRTFQRE